MLVLGKNEIKKLCTMKNAMESNRIALRMHAEGKSLVPLRTNIDMPKLHGKSLFMPAYVDEINAIGIKIASVFPNNIKHNKPSISGQMLLLDEQTGEVCAMLDGTYLTQLRTGALQGVATDLFARRDATRAVLFGAGGQAATQLEAMLTVRNLTEVKVFDINHDRAECFVAAMQKEFAHFNARIIAVKDGNEAVKNADIITAVTTSKLPVFDGTLVKKGTHINGIGAYTPEMQELPEAMICLADKIIFDTNEGVLAEAGDIIIPLRAGKVTEADFHGALGDVIRGKIQSREREDEITVFKAVGTAVLDVVVAHHIYQQAKKFGVGREM